MLFRSRLFSAWLPEFGSYSPTLISACYQLPFPVPADNDALLPPPHLDAGNLTRPAPGAARCLVACPRECAPRSARLLRPPGCRLPVCGDPARVVHGYRAGHAGKKGMCGAQATPDVACNALAAPRLLVVDRIAKMKLMRRRLLVKRGFMWPISSMASQKGRDQPPCASNA